MRCLLCAVVLVASFGYGTCERCGSDYNCRYGCCYEKETWDCCSRSTVSVYVGVCSTFGVLVIIGVVVVIVCLLKKNTRPGRVIHSAPPVPSPAGLSHITAINNTGQIQCGNVLYHPGSTAYPPPGATAPPYPGKPYW
ncbi:uncharacterized protein [Haliotis asinina]|uniref:uncharacterized protein n=1 Tax=Haliotis asinina TaxID=109174 RepID=UPI003531D080